MKRIESCQEVYTVAAALQVPIAVMLIAGLIAAITDVWKFKVHNVLTLPLLASGLLYHGVMGGTSGLVASLMGFLFGFGVLMVLYILGGMGAGDVKFMAALGAWLGMPLTFYIFIASSLAAGVYAVALVLLYGKVRETWLNLRLAGYRLMILGRHLGSDDALVTEVTRTDRRQRLIPFTAMIALGLLVTVLLGWMATAP
jgi:prepilin peptidase CpaA